MLGNNGDRIKKSNGYGNGSVPIFLLCLLLAGCGTSFEGYKHKPYTVRGVHYTPLSPREAVGYVEEGLASHYDESFLFLFPGKTAIGENQYSWSRSAAHKTLPLPCKVRVTNLRNGRSVVIRVNDRGPFIGKRILDVTPAVAKDLGFHKAGLCPVRVQVLSVGDGRWRIRR
ncbi:MAG: septal ring lytic transglycosylase RlpA family protein [Verrucomicrobiae bacterium]